MYRYFLKIGSSFHIPSRKSKKSIDKSINPLASSDNSLPPPGTKTIVKFDESYLRQDKIIFTHEKTVNNYNIYKISLWDHGYDDYLTSEDSLFGPVK